MNKTGEMVRGIAFLVLVTATLGWVVIRSVQKAEDPARMIFKWVLTVLMLIFMFRRPGMWVEFQPDIALDAPAIKQSLRHRIAESKRDEI